MSSNKSKKKTKKRDSRLSTKNIDSIAFLELGKFCTKKLYEIEFLTELTSGSRDLLNRVVEEGTKLQHLSLVHFVTYDGTIDFVKRLANDLPKVALPTFIKDCMDTIPIKILELLNENKPIPSGIFAIIVKLKIIECMYENYISEVEKMRKRIRLNTELENLIKVAEKPKGKEKKKKEKAPKDKKEKKSDKTKTSTSAAPIRSKSTLQVVDNEVIEDYTEITLQENEIIYDYNIDNQVMIYVLTGFKDLGLIEELSKINVHISAIIEFTLDTVKDEPLNDLVLKIHDLFERPQGIKFLESTILMKFETGEGDDMKTILEELVYIFKRISYIKRQHLSYIRTLKLHNFGTRPKKLALKCMDKYNKILNSYPTECINIPVILNALIEEICFREKGQIYSDSNFSLSSNSKPFSDENKKKPPETYRVHENDVLNMILNSYKNVGREIYDKSLHYLKLLKPLEYIDYGKQALPKRTREISLPCDDYYSGKLTNEMSDYFHLALFTQMQRTPFVPKPRAEYEFNQNLITYDEIEAFNSELPRNFDGGEVPEMPRKNLVIDSYCLKEELPQSALLQMIYTAYLEFSCYNKVYCRETETMLLRFHDNLDDFGIDTKIWNQFLRTTVCLRDFCKYVTNENAQWLDQHKLPEHSELLKDIDEGECEGLRNIQLSGLYENYSYLLGSKFHDIKDERGNFFNDIMLELINYPKSDDLVNFSSTEDDNKRASLIAYDLGPRRVQLTGSTKIFHSDDGVKITVDNSRFLSESPKCSINVTAEGHSLSFHTVDPTTFHFTLKDGTIVLLSKPDKMLSTKSSEGKSTTKITIADSRESVNSDDINLSHSLEGEIEESLIDIQTETVVSVDKSNLPDFLVNENLNIKFKNAENNLMELLEMFQRTLKAQRPIYKISFKPSLMFLKRRSSSMNYPIANVIKRVLVKKPRKKTFRSYNITSSAKVKKEFASFYKLHITLPNGLRLLSLPRTGELLEVKQTYQFSHCKEQYRLFYKSGVILIKNSDNTMTILRANGDIIELTDRIESYVGDCLKNMSKIFRKEQNLVQYFRSRGESQIVKDATEFIALYEFGNIPYAKKSLLQFNGVKLTEFNGKVTEEHLYYVIDDNDYFVEEKYFERDDGFRCLVDRKGKRQIQFPDGTRISSWYVIEKELIFVDDHPKSEGWVSVAISYKFEHPYYIGVVYDGIKKETEICLSGNTSIKSLRESFTMDIGTNIKINITSEDISLVKICELCNQICSCEININANNKDSTLLKMLDSYDKRLVCDYYGNCKINSDYIKTPSNRNNCDHWWSCDRQKLFVLKEGFLGMLLWPNYWIEKKMFESSEDKNVKIMNYFNKFIKRQFIEFHTDIYQDFVGRFTMSQMLKQKIGLTKSIQENRTLFYVTYRILHVFQDARNNGAVAEQLKSFLEMNHGVADDLVEGIQEMQVVIKNIDAAKEEKRSYHLTLENNDYDEEEGEASVVENTGSEIPTVDQIIADWKHKCLIYRTLIAKKKFKPYFHSKFYLENI